MRSIVIRFVSFPTKYLPFKGIYALLLICALAPRAFGQQNPLVVGVQNISYYPHYAFSQPDDKGYAWSLLLEFAAQEGLNLELVALPIKRLQVALETGVVDFAYPDNPKWNPVSGRSSQQKYFSHPLTIAMGSTIVKTQNVGKGIESFKSLAVPFGFSPVKWQTLVNSNQVKLVQVKDTMAALELVMLGRVSGADVEFHVARYHMKHSQKLFNLTMDPALPYDVVGFSVSSFKHQDTLIKLDSFIKNHPNKIAELKIRYQLQSPESILHLLNNSD